MVCLYMHFKVGRSGETWDQRNKEQGSFFWGFFGHIRGLADERGHSLRQEGALNITETVDTMSDLNRVTNANQINN